MDNQPTSTGQSSNDETSASLNPQIPQPQPTVDESAQNQQPQAGVAMGGDQASKQVGQGNIPSSSPRRSKKKLLIPLAIILVVVAGLGGAFGFANSHKSAKLNCAPPAGATVDKATAITLYEQVVSAIKASNQTCVNALSSNFFLSYNKQVESPPNGSWITYSPGGVGPLTSDFSRLPKSLVNSKFVGKDYSRFQVQAPTGGNVSYYHPAQGIQLRYPAGITRNNGSGQDEFYFYFGFVSQNGKVVIDSFSEGSADSFF